MADLYANVSPSPSTGEPTVSIPSADILNHPSTQIPPQVYSNNYQNPPNMPIQSSVNFGSQGSQNVRFIGFGERFLAFIIDMILLSIIINLIESTFFPSLSAASEPFTNFLLGETTEQPTDAQWDAYYDAIMYGAIIRFVIYIIYYLICYTAFKGKSIGKAVLGLTVIDLRTMAPVQNIGVIFLDILTKAVDTFVLLIDLFIGLLAHPGPYQQIRISQKWCKTAVVKVVRAPLMPIF